MKKSKMHNSNKTASLQQGGRGPLLASSLFSLVSSSSSSPVLLSSSPTSLNGRRQSKIKNKIVWFLYPVSCVAAALTFANWMQGVKINYLDSSLTLFFFYVFASLVVMKYVYYYYFVYYYLLFNIIKC